MDRSTIKQISEVARIKLTEEEMENLTKEVDMLLSYFKKVEEINIVVESEGSYMHEIKNTFRDDEIKEESDVTKESIRGEFTKREGNKLLAPKSLK
ncbi:MAG: aspartyl/glutamyl-tRNA amidotransferase subunit C [Candidatus Micrarchaeota archaeon]|nr:aspartyl/glutamyl-tRNA amidotransferase subunit C [Candidatus Micrarchaeota archaeon]